MTTKTLVIIITVVMACLAMGLVIVRLLKKLWTNRSEYDTPFVDSFKKWENEHPLIKRIALHIEEYRGKVIFDSIPTLLQTLLPFNIDLEKYYGSANSDPDGLIKAILCEARIRDKSLSDFFNKLNNPKLTGFLWKLSQSVNKLMKKQDEEDINSMPIARIASEKWNNDGGNWDELNKDAQNIIILYTLWENLEIPPCIRTKIDKSLADGVESSEIFNLIADMAKENEGCSFFDGDGINCELCNQNPAYLQFVSTTESEYEQHPFG